MEFNSPQLSISDQMDTALGSLYFKFEGKFTEEASISGAKFWNMYMESRPTEKISLIWDTIEMSGFEMKARSEWYDTLKINKHQIADITVIAKSIVIRGAARVMLEFFNIRYQMFKNVEELMLIDA